MQRTGLSIVSSSRSVKFLYLQTNTLSFPSAEGSCGHLIITPQRVLFKSLFSRKPASTDDEDSDSEGEPVIDATTGEALVAPAALEQAKITTLLDARLENLVALKKVRSVGVGTWTTNGLQITVKGKKVSGLVNAR